MNPISAFFVDHLAAVFFLYGLAFFAFGLALLLAKRKDSSFRFASAVLPLALFGLLHGAHEWVQMFTLMAEPQNAYGPGVFVELVRLTLLGTSFVMLALFAIQLLSPPAHSRLRFWPAAALLVVWGLATWVFVLRNALQPLAAIAVADTTARYILGIPGAVLAAWGLMAQQRQFRIARMPTFGRYLVWCAGALLLYGLVGQAFVRATALPFPMAPTSASFLSWFGIPVELFRTAMAVILAANMILALRVFEEEDRRRLAQAHQAQLTAQATALAAERRASLQTAQLNEELRLVAHKLSLLRDIANLLSAPMAWQERLREVLQQVVQNSTFANAGLILLKQPPGLEPHVAAAIGLDLAGDSDRVQEAEGVDLGRQCMQLGVALGRDDDGAVLRFIAGTEPPHGEVGHGIGPLRTIALTLAAEDRILGSLVLQHATVAPSPLPRAEFDLLVGIARQLGVSVENALMHEEACAREKLLANLLRSVVDAQEAERQRIARELHDATSQSLAAIGLGLRGVEQQLNANCPEEMMTPIRPQLSALHSFSNGALRELRQIIEDLRPPQLDELGLFATMRWYIRTYQQARGVPVHFEARGDEHLLSPEFKTVLFRIMQEALTNVAKHAQAKTAAVCVSVLPNDIELRIEDDGRGFDPSQVKYDDGARHGWGLVGLCERAGLLGGTCTIDSAPGRGTRIHVRAPLHAQRIISPDEAGIEALAPRAAQQQAAALQSEYHPAVQGQEEPPTPVI